MRRSAGFERFPAWMWRNVDVRDFAEWLRGHNQAAGPEGRQESGFYGLDLYSLHRSMNEVIAYLDKVDPTRRTGHASDMPASTHVGEDGQAYGFAVVFGAGLSCEREAVEQLVDIRRNAVA